MTYLDEIVDSHRESARADPRKFSPLLEKARSCEPGRGFSNRIAQAVSESSGDVVAVIAEIKRRTPSKGDLRAGSRSGEIVVAELARQYDQGGATCLSVLTDSTWFGGSAADLMEARALTSLPVLRKDFVVDIRGVLDTKIMGADCVLLIAAVLSDEELKNFHQQAMSLDLDALVEVHDETELEKALSIGATLVGVNQRDLVTFEVDTARAVRMAPLIPDGVIKVAESGIRSSSDVRALAEAGYHAILVGEMLVRSTDPVADVNALRHYNRCNQV